MKHSRDFSPLVSTPHLSEEAALSQNALVAHEDLHSVSNPKSLGHPSLLFLAMQAVWGMGSLMRHETQMKPDIGHSLKFCARIAPTHLAVGTDCRLKVS